MQFLSIMDWRGNQMFYSILALIPIILLLFTIAILFIRSIHQLYQNANPEFRTIEPIMTWLLMLPLFNFVWMFVVLRSVQQLLYQELRIRNIVFEGDRLYNIGVVLGVSNIFILFPYVRWVSIPTSLILFIIYWTQILKYKRLLATTNPVLTSKTVYLD